MTARLLPAFAHYRCWLFDCDGVLLDSNRLKTDAFGVVGARYGDAVAAALVEFHVANGGISRYAKMQYLFDGILGRAPRPGEMAECLAAFADEVGAALLKCEEAPRLRDVLAALPAGTRRYVVSGTDQDELRGVLQARGLAASFDGIFGSPRSKHDILRDLEAQQPLARPALFVGDSKYDRVAADDHGLDFLYVSNWSEWASAASDLSGSGARQLATLGDVLQSP